MGDYDEKFVNKYQKFIDVLSKQADDYIAKKYGISPPSEEKVSEDNDEKPICTTNEFIDACNELGLVEDKL